MAQSSGKSNIGCLGSLSLLFLVAVGILVLLSPWALHMGGRWTPALIWHGYGTLQSSSGPNSEIFVELNALSRGSRRARRSAGLTRSDNIGGTAILCTPQGEQLPFDVSGSVDAWLDADNKAMILRLTSPKNSPKHYSATLYGGWQGTQLNLQDRGTLAAILTPPVAPATKAPPRTPPSAQKQVPPVKLQPVTRSATLQYGKKTEFDSVCKGSGDNSF